jgi:hypothetical protein
MCGALREYPAISGETKKLRFANSGVVAAAAVLHHGGVPKTKPARCEDCYFRQNMLCALNLGGPCTTFRLAEKGLAPERQLAFVFRAERTTAAYAFPQPRS